MGVDYVPFGIFFLDDRFLIVNLALLWACANAMLHSFEDMISWDQQILSSRFTGLILIPIAATAAEVLPRNCTTYVVASYIMARNSKE